MPRKRAPAPDARSSPVAHAQSILVVQVDNPDAHTERRRKKGEEEER